MNIRFLIPLLLAMPLALSAQIYRHVDDDGRVTYSDQPHPDAEEVELPSPSVYEAPRRQPAPAPAPDAEPPAPAYQNIAIADPPHEGTVRDNEGRVQVRIHIQPELREHHELELLLDGEPVAGGRSLSYELENVYRGAHQLQVRVRDRRGDVVAESDSSTFYMHQASRLFPQRQ
ncbi:MAG: DUF4124 domain-containing protein [Ectothiorhodospiraceae bacterium]|nr:DUF4124 domain-containing protein [Ectothiorhodospiraceae bacterium]